MTDIESIKSAIIAIDQEKDYCDACMATLHTANADTITIAGKDYMVTQPMAHGIISILHGYYAARRMELVSKAYELMK